MIYYLQVYIVMLIAFFAIDMTWLGLGARAFYREHLGFLMAPTVNWLAAIIFYLLFVVGVLFFVVVPGLGILSLKTTFLRAALFGLITYATYDLTNLATVKDWSAVLTIVDMLWGIFLSVSVSYLGFMAGTRLSGAGTKS